MTDTLITVDVSSAALVSRAREGQAVARENLLRQERERQERKKQEKARRERLDREQADRLGRSRLRKGGRREEVAAGYVERYSLAGAFVQFVTTRQNYNDEDPASTTGYWVWKIHSGNQKASIELKYDWVPESEFGAGPISWGERWHTFPAGGDAMVLVVMPQVYGLQYANAIYSFYITDNSIRTISTPSSLASRLLQADGNIYTGAASFHSEVILEKSNGWPSNQPEALSTFWSFYPSSSGGDLGSLQRLTETTVSEPPGYLVFYTKRLSRTLTAKIYKTVPPVGNGVTARWATSAARLTNEETYSFYTGTEDGTLTWDPEQYPEFGSYRLLAWDWGKPQLCRRLLLQLGFRPEDLRP